MRYFINFDKTINQFVPHYIGGRKLILLLQALMKPLQSVNEAFSTWAKETRIEASMTSQIFKFEWYLNRKFGKYFLNPGSRIVISNSNKTGVPIYYQSANINQDEHLVMYNESNGTETGKVFYREHENVGSNNISFIVSSPQIDTTKISIKDYESMLYACIEKYRLAGKTYMIKYNN